LVNSRNIKLSVELTIKFIKLSLLLALFGIVVIVLIPSGFYRFVFGPEFGDIRKVVISLSPGILFFSISFILSAFYSGTGRHYINSISSIVGLIAIVVFSLLLIPIMGIVGAGISASISYILTTIIKLSYFKPISGINKNDLRYNKSDIKSIKLLLQSLFSLNNK